MVSDFLATFENTDRGVITIGHNKVAYDVLQHVLVLNGESDWVSTVEADAEQYIDINAGMQVDRETTKFLMNRAERRRRLSMAKRKARRASSSEAKAQEVCTEEDAQETDQKAKAEDTPEAEESTPPKKQRSELTQEELDAFAKNLRTQWQESTPENKAAIIGVGGVASGFVVGAGLRALGFAHPVIGAAVITMVIGGCVLSYLESDDEDDIGQRA